MEIVTFWALLILAGLALVHAVLNGGASFQVVKDEPPTLREPMRRHALAHVVVGIGAILALVGLFAGRWFALVGGLVAAVGYLGFGITSRGVSQAKNALGRGPGSAGASEFAQGAMTGVVLAILIALPAIGFFLVRG